MEYIHVANIKPSIENPLDAFLKLERNRKNQKEVKGNKEMTKIQEMLNIGWEEYKKENKIPTYKIKVMEAIKNCKTEKM